MCIHITTSIYKYTLSYLCYSFITPIQGVVLNVYRIKNPKKEAAKA
jgi:hypothetical protein